MARQENDQTEDNIAHFPEQEWKIWLYRTYIVGMIQVHDSA